MQYRNQPSNGSRHTQGTSQNRQHRRPTGNGTNRRPPPRPPNRNGGQNKNSNNGGDWDFYVVVGLIAAIFISLIIIFSAINTLRSGDDLPDDSLNTTDDSLNTTDDTTKQTDSSDTEPQVTDPPDTTGPFPSPTILTKTADMGQAYIDRIVFLGDSTTNGLKFYQILPGGKQTTQVWTPLSGTLMIGESSKAKIIYPEKNEEIYIYEAAAQKKPDILVITLGHNFSTIVSDKAKRELYFKNEYKKLINVIKESSPDTKIILQSIFPIVSSIYKKVSNDVINERNGWILDVAEEMGLHYLDTASYFKDESGDMIEKYTNGDGCHFNADGYRRELEYIRTHALID